MYNYSTDVKGIFAYLESVENISFKHGLIYFALSYV